MADNKFDIRFENIEHGWLSITVAFSVREFLIDASDAPADPIAPLVSLACFLLSAERGTREIAFHLEPEHCILTATKSSDGETVDIRLVDPEHDDAATGLSCDAVAARSWRAVSAFERYIRDAITARHWSWNYPETQMQMLATEVRSRRQRAD